MANEPPKEVTIKEGETFYPMAYIETPDGSLLTDAMVSNAGSDDMNRFLYDLEAPTTNLLEGADLTETATDVVNSLATDWNWEDTSVGYNYRSAVTPDQATFVGGKRYLFELEIPLEGNDTPAGVTGPLEEAWLISVQSTTHAAS